MLAGTVDKSDIESVFIARQCAFLYVDDASEHQGELTRNFINVSSIVKFDSPLSYIYIFI